jgi:putative nucleotidyltransferase with HDIG domain
MSLSSEKKSLKSRFFEGDFKYRLLAGFICWICLACFLHFREVKVEMLQINSTANKFIVAQVDFEFPDEEATIILKQDVLRDIGNIYQIDDREVRHCRFDFENFLLKGAEFDKLGKNSSYEQIYEVADAVENMLIQLRFTDSRTLQKMKDFNLSTEHYLIFNPSKSGILPSRYWDSLKDFSLKKDLQSKFGNGLSGDVINLVVHFFQSKEWPLVHDTAAEVHFKGLVDKRIPQKFTKVKAGSRIVGQGENVASKHVAMLQAMKQALNETRNLLAPLMILGDLFLSLIFIILAILFFRIDYAEVLKSFRKISVIVCIVVLTLLIAKVTEYILLSDAIIGDAFRFPLLVPFAAFLLTILINHRVALYISAFLSVILSVVLAVDHSRFLVMNLITAVVVIVSVRSLKKRTDVFAICGKCWLGSIPVIFSFNLLNNSLWNKLLITDMGCSLLFCSVTAVLVVGILPMLEYIFKVMTDITLMEYMDPNNELLKRLSLEAPGTYQHSIAVGNIAEITANIIGANGLFCRVAALYHDLGKLCNAHYFTENQQNNVNIHQLLTPMESAQVIISHVKEGEAIAKKYKLPQSFIDIIEEHHGTTLVYYFYRKELEVKKDATLVDEKKFRYPGPKPRSKEAAIMMLTDSVEAASRSIEETSEEALQQMVDKIAKDKVDDGQFDECGLTFEELSILKKSMVKALISTRHVRVKYPEKEHLYTS